MDYTSGFEALRGHEPRRLPTPRCYECLWVVRKNRTNRKLLDAFKKKWPVKLPKACPGDFERLEDRAEKNRWRWMGKYAPRSIERSPFDATSLSASWGFATGDGVREQDDALLDQIPVGHQAPAPRRSRPKQSLTWPRQMKRSAWKLRTCWLNPVEAEVFRRAGLADYDRAFRIATSDSTEFAEFEHMISILQRDGISAAVEAWKSSLQSAQLTDAQVRVAVEEAQGNKVKVKATAEAMGISEGAVKMLRYRRRKKRPHDSGAITSLPRRPKYMRDSSPEEVKTA